MELTEILKDIFLVSAIVFSIALIYFVFQLTKSVQLISKNFDRITIRLLPVIDSVHNFSEQLVKISEKINTQLQKTDVIISKVKSGVDKILSIENNVQNKIEDGVFTITNNYKALKLGVETFWMRYKN